MHKMHWQPQARFTIICKLHPFRQRSNIHNIRPVPPWSYVAYCITDAMDGVMYSCKHSFTNTSTEEASEQL